jgi:hypothetical protein
LRRRNLIAALLPIWACGCIAWFAARVSPMNSRGEWRGTIVQVPAIDELSGEPVSLVGLHLTEESRPIKRGNQKYTPLPGELVMLVDKHGSPANICPTDQVVRVKGLWTDRWNAATLQGKRIKIMAPAPRALGVLQVRTVTPVQPAQQRSNDSRNDGDAVGGRG